MLIWKIIALNVFFQLYFVIRDNDLRYYTLSKITATRQSHSCSIIVIELLKIYVTSKK